MARSVATIGVSVTARTAKFRKGMKNAQRRLKAFGASVGRVMRRVARFSAILVTGGVAALTLFVRSQLKSIDSLAKTSKKLGVATEDLVGFHHAAKLAGLETRTFNMALQRMTRRVSEAARDTGEAKDAIKELRLDAKKLNTAGPSEALRMIADALSRVTNQADRVRLAFKLFDSEGVAMINMLQEGRGALERAADEVRRFGTAISGVQATQIEQANDAITRLKESLRGLGVQLTVRLSSAIEGLSRLFTDWGIAAKGASNVVVAGVGRTASALGAVLDILWQIKIGFKTMAMAGVEAFVSLQQSAAKFIAQLVSPSGPMGMLERALGKRMPLSLGVTLDMIRARANAPRASFAGADLGKQMRDEITALLKEGPPSAALKEIFDNLARASRQNAEAAERAADTVKAVRPSQVRAPATVARGALTRFIEVDLSRTFVQGLRGERGRKQLVNDPEVVRELQGLRTDIGSRQSYALVGP